MADENKDLLEAILRRFYHQNIISRVLSFQCEKATSKGDNYTSNMKRIRLNVVLNSGKVTMDSIIIKELPIKQFSREAWINTGIFPVEITVYRDLLPQMENIMAEFNDFTEPMWPKCLDFTPNERIILEDLTKYGYKMVKRKQALDWEHCALVMKCLAKFHAISLVLQERNLINLNIFGEHIYQRKSAQKVLGGLIQEYFRKLIITIENSWGPDWIPITKRLRREIAPNIMKLLPNLMQMDRNKFNVLCHGDCWLNNILFKYSVDLTTPVALRFVDFQNTFYNSPVFDLKQFLATSPNIEVRYNSIDSLIDVYHGTLLIELERYEYEGNVITLKTLKEEYKRIDLFGLVATMSILPVVLLEDSESLPDMEDVLRCAAENKIETIDFNPFERAPVTAIDIIKYTLREMFQESAF